MYKNAEWAHSNSTNYCSINGFVVEERGPAKDQADWKYCNHYKSKGLLFDKVFVVKFIVPICQFSLKLNMYSEMSGYIQLECIVGYILSPNL